MVSSHAIEIVYTFHISHSCYMTRLRHHLWYNHPNSIWWRVQIRKYLIMHCSSASCFFIFLGPNILNTILISKAKICKLCVLMCCEYKAINLSRFLLIVLINMSYLRDLSTWIQILTSDSNYNRCDSVICCTVNLIEGLRSSRRHVAIRKHIPLTYWWSKT